MRAREFLKEDQDDFIKSFIPFAKQELGIDDLPDIKVVDTVPGTDGTTFGRYDPEAGCVYVVVKGRHPKDALRTLAHELVHYQQDVEQRLNADSGETGSNEENEANARAGVIMRNFNQANPEQVAENYKDGRHPEDKGDSKRHGIKKHSTLSDLDKIVHSKSASPRKKQLAHWQANMRRGRAKKK